MKAARRFRACCEPGAQAKQRAGLIAGEVRANPVQLEIASQHASYGYKKTEKTVAAKRSTKASLSRLLSTHLL